MALLGSQAARHEGTGLEAFRGITEGVFIYFCYCFASTYRQSYDNRMHTRAHDKI